MTTCAYLNAGVVMINFPGKLLPAGCEDDVVNSLLLAQLALCDDHSDPSDLVAKERCSQEFLQKFCWIVESTEHRETERTAAFNIVDLLSTECEKKFKPAVASQFLRLFSELKTTRPTKRAFSVWQGRVVAKAEVQLDVLDGYLTVEESQVCVKFAVLGTGPEFYTLTMSFVTHSALIPDFLNQEVMTAANKSVVLEAKSYTLNTHAYKDYRKLIAERVKGKKKEYVMAWGAA